MKKTTAQRKERQQSRREAGKRSFKTLLPWLVSAPMAAIAYFLKFVIPGYSFTALVICVLIFIILFYSVTGQLLPRWPGIARVRKFFTVCLVIGLLIVGITEAFVIKASFGEPEDSCEYMVVLGASVREAGPSNSLWDRIYGARDYLEAHPNVIAIVSGGQGPDEPMTEARAMYDELVKLGIDPNRIWMEDKATSTWENLQFSLKLIEEKTGGRPTKIGLLSSEYHMLRASLFADACGVDAVMIPARTTRLSQKINHFMREVAGIWHYIILGGQYHA